MGRGKQRPWHKIPLISFLRHRAGTKSRGAVCCARASRNGYQHPAGREKVTSKCGKIKVFGGNVGKCRLLPVGVVCFQQSIFGFMRILRMRVPVIAMVKEDWSDREDIRWKRIDRKIDCWKQTTLVRLVQLTQSQISFSI